MMAFIDIFYLMGMTPFSFEPYLGSLFLFGKYTPYGWILGFFANMIMGGIFGFLYAYCFEYVFYEATPRAGFKLGFWHAVAAALAFFPFFGSVHEFLGVNLYPQFGILGLGLGAPTFILLITGHLLFGANIGLFYGDVCTARVRARYFEPGDHGMPGDLGVITTEEDNQERIAV